MHAALCDRFQNDCITVLATDGLALKKTAELAKLLFGSAHAAGAGDRTLVVYAPNESRPRPLARAHRLATSSASRSPISRRST